MPGKRRVIHFTAASDTLPTDMVLVSRMGVSSKPHSTTWVSPETSPAPFSTNEPASTRSEKIGSGGRMAVTPVRTGPSPTTSGPSPSIKRGVTHAHAGYVGDGVGRARWVRGRWKIPGHESASAW